jgi:hypothetical protein
MIDVRSDIFGQTFAIALSIIEQRTRYGPIRQRARGCDSTPFSLRVSMAAFNEMRAFTTPGPGLEKKTSDVPSRPRLRFWP